MVDIDDQIHDQHGGFAMRTDAFKPTALTRGIGYILPQQYRVGGTTVGQYLIHRTTRGGSVTVNKSEGSYSGGGDGGGATDDEDEVPLTVQVQRGDTLWVLAERHLGDGRRWPEIYELNRATVGNNPNLILPVQVLQLPRS